MSATDFRRQAPVAAAPRPYRFPTPQRLTLPNGLRVLIARHGSAPLISVRAVVRSGAERDAEQLPGTTSFTADMLDEGAGDRDAIQIAEAIGELGGSLGSGADWDASYVYVDVLARGIDRALELASDLLLRPRFDERELERLRAERLTEIVQERDQPASIASKNFARFLYRGTPYGTPVGGNEESVQRLTRDGVAQFHAAHFTPSNTSLIVCGDLDPVGVRTLVESRFSEQWHSASAVAPLRFEVPEQPGSRICLIDRGESVQSEIRIGHPGVSRTNPDFFPLVVMNGILGGVFGSRLNLNLRERHGFTYAIRSALGFRRQAGPFVVSTAVRNAVTADSVREILIELDGMRSGNVTDAELVETKNYLAGVFPATVQTASDLASRLQEIEIYGLGDDYFETYRERIAAVTIDDVTRVARQYIHPKRATVVVVGRAEEISAPLSALGLPVERYDVDGNRIA